MKFILKGKSVDVSDRPLTVDLLTKYGQMEPKAPVSRLSEGKVLNDVKKDSELNLDKIIEELKIWGITWKYC